MTLPPFEENATCQKCGHDEVRTIYSATGQYCRDEGLSWRDGEHLCRVCQRCHFAWAEAVLAPAAPAGEGS